MKLEGFKYCYKVEGVETDNEPMLFVNGAFQSMSSWRLFTQHFSKKTRTIVADLPGMGTADRLPTRYNLGFLADAIHAILQREKISNVYLVSASYGTLLATIFAQRYPQCISRMVLAGVADRFSQHMHNLVSTSRVIYQNDGPIAFARYGVQNLMYGEHDAPTRITNYAVISRLLERQLSKFTRSQFEKYVSNSLRMEGVRSLKYGEMPNVDYLVFTGEYDTVTPPASCSRVARNLPNCYFTAIKSADHLFHLERTDVTISLLEDFLTPGGLKANDGCHPIEFYERSQEPQALVA